MSSDNPFFLPSFQPTKMHISERVTKLIPKFIVVNFVLLFSIELFFYLRWESIKYDTQK